MARRRRAARHRRRYSTDWCAFTMTEIIDNAVDPNGLVFDLTPYMPTVVNSVQPMPITILRVVGTVMLHTPLTGAGNNTVVMASWGLRVAEHGPTGNIFDGDMLDPAFAEDSWMHWQTRPIGSVKAIGSESAEDLCGSPDSYRCDVGVSRRCKADEQGLLLQVQVTPIPGFAAVSVTRLLASLRVLWRISAAGAPG